MPIANDSFDADQPWWQIFQPAFVTESIVGGSLVLVANVGGAGGTFWFNLNDGFQKYQLTIGDFDVVMECRVSNGAGTSVPPADGAARIAGLSVHHPNHTTLNYYHRGGGRAPGGAAGTGVIDEWKYTINGVSIWNTFVHPSTSDGVFQIRIRRVGTQFTSWTRATSADAWANQHQITLTNLPDMVAVGPMIYSSSTNNPDIRLTVGSIYNNLELPAMPKSNYFETAVLNVLRNTGITGLANVYVGLSTADPTDDASGLTEPVGGSYARVAVTFAAPAQVGGVATMSNSVEVAFPTATGNWGTITHWALFDALTNGNMIYHEAVVQSRTVNTGDTARFAVGTLTVGEA